MRKVINHKYANYMIQAYDAVKRITDEGGLAYETRSAIWTYEPASDRVMLIVKAPNNMSNGVIDYNTGDKHHKTHKDRIIKLTGATPTAFKMAI